MDSRITESEGTSGMRVVTRQQLFDNMQEQDLQSFDEKLIYLVRYILSQDDYCEEQKKEIKHKLSYLKSQFKKKWMEAHKKSQLILQKNEMWLQGIFEIPKDVPKAGFGNTNDGNTSRRFFANSEIFAKITGVDLNLIKRLKVILEVISSSHKVDLTKFALYGYETAQLYINLYLSHPMTPTMHKVLIHGAIVIKNALLPIGLLSEEAAEACNKHIRLYRQNYARKFSREQCNLDVMKKLLLNSDHLISSIRPKPKKKSMPHSEEVLQMLITADAHTTEESFSDEETTAEESDNKQQGWSSGEETWDSSS